MTDDNAGAEMDDAMHTDALSRIAAGPAAVTAALKGASEATGAGFELLYNMARRESSLDPAARAKTSSAAGLFQFIEETWLAAVKKYGARHGLSEQSAAIAKTASGRHVVADPAAKKQILDLRFDPAKAAALAGELAAENRRGLETKLGRAVGDAEIYAAHFLGVGGAAKLLSAEPDARAAELLPRAAAANRPVFYDGARAKSVSEVMASMAKSMGGAASAPARAPDAASLGEIAVRASAGEGAPRIAAPALRESLPALERKSAATPALAAAEMAERTRLAPLAFAVLRLLDEARLGGARDRA